MGAKRPQFTIFKSRRDKALEISGDFRAALTASAAPTQALRRHSQGARHRGGGHKRAPFTRPARPQRFCRQPRTHRSVGTRLASQSMVGGSVTLADQVGMAAVDFAGSAAKLAAATPASMVSSEAREVLRRELSGTRAPLQNGGSPTEKGSLLRCVLGYARSRMPGPARKSASDRPGSGTNNSSRTGSSFVRSTRNTRKPSRCSHHAASSQTGP